MKISLKKAYNSKRELIQRIPNYFNDYIANDSSINIYYQRHLIATIDLNSMILDADVQKINSIGSLKENLSVCRKLDILACI